MPVTESKYALLYDREVLRARIAIQQHYLNQVAKDIYENSGQLLSLVRYRLATLANQAEIEIDSELNSSAELIGEVIRNWKEMSRQFLVENEITSEAGLIQALKRELITAQIVLTGSPFALAPEPGLILLSVFIDLTVHLSALFGKEFLQMEIHYTHINLAIILKFPLSAANSSPEAIKRREYEEIRKLKLEKRLKWIEGSIIFYRQYKAQGKIGISVPC